MPDKRRLVTSKIYFGSEKAGLLENSYHKWALVLNQFFFNDEFVKVKFIRNFSIFAFQ